MANLRLEARSALGGYAQDFGKVRLAEVTDLGLAAVAMPQRGKTALGKAVRAAWGLALPDAGQSVKKDGARLIRTAQDQFLLVVAGQGPDIAVAAAEMLGTAGYVTEQTDAYAALRIEGEHVRPCLERIVMLDLHDGAFPVGRAERTLMEHIGVIICREGSDSFLLLSARSSAHSFLHAVETSIVNVI